MPSFRPPERPPADPLLVTQRAGLSLSRVHSQAFEPAQLNPTLADSHWEGGRFDATATDPYPFLYAGSDDECAVCEAVLRDVPLDGSSGRFVVHKAVEELVLSRMTLEVDVVLVSLCDGKDLARIGQNDSWLVSCPSAEYGFTRRWCQAIRRWVPEAQGLAWRSRRDPSKFAYVLFGDRLPADFAAASSGVFWDAGGLPLGSGIGRLYLQSILEQYSATLPV